MKALLAIILLGVAGWGGWQYLDDLLAQERFGAAVEQAIDDPRTTTPDQIRRTIQTAAEREGMTVDPEAIDVSVTASDVDPLAGQMVAGAGLAVTSQRMTVRVPYTRTVWGRLQHRTVERARVFVASAAPGVNTEEHALSRLPNNP